MASAGVLAGMAAAGAAATCFDGAVILQARHARAVEREHALRPALLARLAGRPGWLLGTAIAILGWPLQLLAFGLAPVSVVQPMLALGMVLLLAAGTRALGERVGAREWIGVAAVLAGTTVLAVAHPHHTDSSPRIVELAVVSVTLGALVVLPFVRGSSRSGAWTLICSAGCAFALTALTGKFLTIELAHGRIGAALAWGAMTAAVAAAGFLVDMTAMQRFEATRVAPPMFVLETAIPVALAPTLFGERWTTASGGVAAVLAGILLVLAGGALLGASRRVASAAGQLEHEIGGGRERSVAEVRAAR